MPPSQLLDALYAFRRRVKVLAVLAGTGWAIAVAVGAVLGIVLLDYLLNLPPAARVLLLAGGLGYLGYALARWVVRPAAARLSLGDVAGYVETAFPQFNDSLRSTVNFATAPDVPGADVMKRRVSDQAAALAGQVDLRAAIATRPVRDAALIAGGAVAALALLAALAPGLSRIAFSRLVAPFGDNPWPKSVQIAVGDELPARVAVGQQVPVSIRLERGDRPSRRAVIRYQYFTPDATGRLVPDAPAQQQLMTRGDDGTYTASLDARLPQGVTTGELRVTVEAGDDARALRTVTIVPRLAVQSVTATIAAPAYAKLPPGAVNLLERPATLVAGSTVDLTATFNKPLAPDVPVTIDVLGGADTPTRPDVAWTTPDPFTRTARFVPAVSMRFHLIATDTDGLRSGGLEEYELLVRPDQSPVVQIEEPRRSEERTADATVPLRAVAEDDFAIASATLLVERLGGADNRDGKWEIPLIADGGPTGGATRDRVESSADRQRVRVGYAWRLAELAGADLQPGDVLEYHVAVTDNYDLNGATHEPAVSGKLRVTIISQEDFAARVAEEIRTISGQTREVRNAQTRTAMETADLARETAGKPQLDDADRAAVERLANQQSTAAAQTKQLTGKLEALLRRMGENQSTAAELEAVAREASEILNQTAESPMRDAANRLSDAKARDADAADARRADMDKAADAQADADQGLQRAIDKLGNVGTLTDTIDGFKGILDQQERVSKELADVGKRNVGKSPEQMTREDREQLETLAKEQEALAKRTDQAVEQAQRDAGKIEKSDPSSAEAMKQAAKTAQQQNVSGNQRQAGKSAQQNQQAQAQSAQKRAELGLEMIINRLREAENRKLEELAKQLADLQEQLATLVRRQAGHNLDNLVAQDPAKLDAMDTVALAALLEQAQRSRDNLPPAPEVGQLSAAQQQTERNARDIVKLAEATPDGTATAGHLTRAASRMERAVVHLRGGKLPDAYEPPQVEALAALVDAKRLVDEQKKKADDRLAEQQGEAVRARYVKIRDAQQKLNDETAALDKAPRTDDGNRRRQDLVRLGQMPGEQGALAEQAKAIEQDLAAAGGIVYVWANKDIVRSMGDAKAELAKPETGEAVRADQARVVEQLDAMIRNLAIKPLEKKFESPGGGAGGGGGQPGARLPAEAELRLLKELQLAVNKTTKALDKLPARPVDDLDLLGGRQRELRDLLDQLMQKATQGQVKLGPEPDPKDQLPEEAGEGDVEDQELDQDLLTGKPADGEGGGGGDESVQRVNRVGDRMARSRQRLGITHDPGRVTQVIQDRILRDLDDLIEQARDMEATPKPDPNAQPKPGQMGQPRPQVAQRQGAQQPGQPREGGQSPTQQSTAGQGGAPPDAPPKDIKQTLAEWGRTSPRLRQAIVDMEDESVVEKYKALVDDYYRSLAERANER